jgi:hypothetical protein
MDPNYNRAKLTTANFFFILMLPPSNTTYYGRWETFPEKREGEITGDDKK